MVRLIALLAAFALSAPSEAQVPSPHAIDIPRWFTETFLDMREEEIAAAMDLTVRTVQRDWVKARLWLRRALTHR